MDMLTLLCLTYHQQTLLPCCSINALCSSALTDDAGEPARRAKQLLRAMYGNGRWVRR